LQKNNISLLIVLTRIILAKRKEYFGEERPLNPPPKHVFLTDTRHHPGTANPEKIDLVKIGWEEGIFDLGIEYCLLAN